MAPLLRRRVLLTDAPATAAAVALPAPPFNPAAGPVGDFLTDPVVAAMRLLPLLGTELPNAVPPPARAVLLTLVRVKEEVGEEAAGGVSARPNAIVPGWLRRGAGEEPGEEPAEDPPAEGPPAMELMRLTGTPLDPLPPAAARAGFAAVPLVDAMRLAAARPHTAPPPPPALPLAGRAPVADGTLSLGSCSLFLPALATIPLFGDGLSAPPSPLYCPVLPPLMVRERLSPPCDMARLGEEVPAVPPRTTLLVGALLSPPSLPPTTPAGSSPLIGTRPSSTWRAASCAVMRCVTAGSGSPDLRRCGEESSKMENYIPAVPARKSGCLP